MSDKNYGSEIKRRLIILQALLILGNLPVAGQIKKGETVFGLQLRGVVPISLLDAGNIDLTNDSITANYSAPAGFSIGGIIRHNFTKMFTIETGIHYISRKYKVNMLQTLRGHEEISRVNLVSYEIPLQWLLYIRLGDRFYMNTLFGVSFDFYPSNIAHIGEKFAYIMVRKSWFNVALPASVGFEFRSKESGTFYLGMSLHYPFSIVGRFRVSYFPDPTNTAVFVNIDADFRATYFSIDFRYFFKKTIYKKERKIW